MKPQTFANYICQNHYTLAQGWISGAAFEVHSQVVLDSIIRSHLTSRVGAQDGTPPFLAQDEGNQLYNSFWDPMREKPYPVLSDNLTKLVADFYLNNQRFVWNGQTQTYTLKTTQYYIELKCESPVTNDFGGLSVWDAYQKDKGKLLKVKEYDEHNGIAAGGRRRYWMVMIAFSTDKIGDMKAEKWTVQDTVQDFPSMFVGLDEF